MTITEKLISLSNEKDADFSAKLIPNIDRSKILGIKVPVLRKLAKEYFGTAEGKEFLNELPHKYLEENSLHFFMVSFEKDFDKQIELVNAFLPYLDNWATCDEFSSPAFRKHPDRLLPYINTWIDSGETYTVRFGIGMLLKYFLDDNYFPEVLKKVAIVRSDEYYVNMMIAWFFATALAKRYDDSVKYFTTKTLSDFCHNKAIQKARESYRVSDEHKAFLKTLKV